MPSQTTYSFDRPRFYALVVSRLTGQAFELPGIETWSYSKGDDGASGTWSIRVPIRQDYDTVTLTPLAGTQPYAAVASSNDLIAFYAQRTSIGDFPTPTSVEPIRPPVVPSGGSTSLSLPWGDANAATVTALGTQDCVFIGFVDSVRCGGSPGQPVYLSLNGRDLTKIFETNDVGIPDTGAAAGAGVGNPQSGDQGFFSLQTVELSQQNSGSKFLVKLLDLLCAKQLSAFDGLLTDPTQKGNILALLNDPKNAAGIATFMSFGFPWRNFIRLDALDPNYYHLAKNAYPPFTPQMGAVWATIMEIKNAPISRLFVNELGQIIFDDSLYAWTGIPSDTYSPPPQNKYAYGKVLGIIGPEDVRDFDFGFDDHDLVTFLSVLPNTGTMGITKVDIAKGQYIAGSGFTDGVMEAANAAAAHVQTLGYRYGQYESQFDFNFDDAALRRQVILTDHNSLSTGSLTLRGDPKYRIGTRFQVALDSPLALAPNSDPNRATDAKTLSWYVRSVQHQGTWGEDYTTSVELRFPMSEEFKMRPQAKY